MSTKILPAYRFPKEVAALFSEYTNMLIEGDASFQKYLEIQNYDAAYCDDQLAGCIGLRKIDDENCEMKRLYVRPEFRGKRIGNQLVQKVIDDAREIGYAHMLLDTLPFLQSAIHMYRQYGFYEIPSYNDSPMDTSIYMRLDL